MIERLPIDLIVEIGILAGPDEYEQIAKTSKRNAIILQKPYIIRATHTLIDKVTTGGQVSMNYQGSLHSFNDQPAIIDSKGTKYWCQHGFIHRDNDQPAVIFSDNHKLWFQRGNLHRDNDQPAIIRSNGNRGWYQGGNLHRDNDQPAVISDFSKKWY
jgi:hypothetical protein